MSCKNIRDTVILVDNINLFVLKLKYIQSNYKKWNVSQLRNHVIANKVYLLKNVRGCYKISVLLMYDSIALLYYFSSFCFFLFCNVKKINDSLLKKKPQDWVNRQKPVWMKWKYSGGKRKAILV